MWITAGKLDLTVLNLKGVARFCFNTAHAVSYVISVNVSGICII
jgi:hypothetical protein